MILENPNFVVNCFLSQNRSCSSGVKNGRILFCLVYKKWLIEIRIPYNVLQCGLKKTRQLYNLKWNLEIIIWNHAVNEINGCVLMHSFNSFL